MDLVSFWYDVFYFRHLAVDLLNIGRDNEGLLAKCCARCSGPKEERNILHGKVRKNSL